MGLAGRLFARGVLIVLLVAASVLGVSGCGVSGEGDDEGSRDGGDQQNGTLTVFAAASLTDAFGELAGTFEEEHPGVEVRQSFGASSELLVQIQQGAPADIYASADEPRMDAAVEDDLVSGEPETFVRNREVIVVPKDNPAGIEDFRDLSEPGIRLVLAEDEVPAAEYALDVLENADEEYGGGFKQAVLENIVSREADVRASVNRVVVGDADATFGYQSDVTPDVREDVEVIEIPEDLNVVATYPIASMEAAEDEELRRTRGSECLFNFSSLGL